MRLACGICKARSPEFGDKTEAFTWVCSACMKKNTWHPPKPKKPRRKVKVQDLELTESIFADLTKIDESKEDSEIY